MREASLMPVAEVPRHQKPKNRRQSAFFRNHGIAIVAFVTLMLWTCCVALIAGRRVRTKTEERLSAQYAAEYEAKLQAYIDEQEAMRRTVGDESLRAQMEREADAIARAVGPMKTKNMKLTMCWNILARVDSPFYPDTVEDVVNQPQQWMFYDAGNPIRDDDRELVLEQVKLWHEGRYPAKFTNEFVYAEWSSNDYQLRDTWEKTSRTEYWRYPE